MPQIVKSVFAAFSVIFLSIVFSFLIVFDLAKLRKEVKRLQATRLHDFFQETAMPVIRFAEIVGRAFEAQMFIAIINTGLTALGMVFLGVPKVAFLSIIVFLCSFVPVLGVFISSIPITLIAFNARGTTLSIEVIVMVIIVHLLEAYVLNPRIYAHHMKMNPVFVLIVLFIGHHLFNVWGVLLGVPVSYYFITHVAGLGPSGSRRKRSRRGKRDEEEALEESEFLEIEVEPIARDFPSSPESPS